MTGSGPTASPDQSAEVYVPATGHHCTLPSLPTRRYGHTMEGRTVCGGRDTEKSCLTLSDGRWETTTTLLENR